MINDITINRRTLLAGAAFAALMPSSVWASQRAAGLPDRAAVGQGDPVEQPDGDRQGTRIGDRLDYEILHVSDRGRQDRRGV